MALVKVLAVDIGKFNSATRLHIIASALITWFCNDDDDDRWQNAVNVVVFSCPFCRRFCDAVSKCFLQSYQPPCATERSVLHLVQWANFSPCLEGRMDGKAEEYSILKTWGYFLYCHHRYCPFPNFRDSVCWTSLKIEMNSHQKIQNSTTLDSQSLNAVDKENVQMRTQFLLTSCCWVLKMRQPTKIHLSYASPGRPLRR